MRHERDASIEPCGIPLTDLKESLERRGCSGEIQGWDTLVLASETHTTEISVREADRSHDSPDPIQARVTIICRLAPKIADALDQPEKLLALNGLAAMGGLRDKGDEIAVESALTVFEDEGAWAPLQQPLIEAAAMHSADAILGAICGGAANESTQEGESAWGGPDFKVVESVLSGMCVCNADTAGLTAEFGLSADAVTVGFGGCNTALYQQMPDQPHPHLGGGLLCKLEMPHCYADLATLASVCGRLNMLEMTTMNQPPHFGAWCEGRLGGNPAYVTFLPNVLHGVNRIALNEAIWALSRAIWAQSQIEQLAGELDGPVPIR
jgi:hypothetical protein